MSAPIIPGEAVLRSLLRPFAAALAMEGTREIVVNRPGHYGVEGGNGWTWHEDASLTYERLDAIATVAAAQQARRIGPDRPTITGKLPDGERLFAARPPATAPGIVSINIRRRAADFVPTLPWLAEGGYFRELDQAVDWPAFWQRAIVDRRTILVCGEVGSSKTTFAEALLRAIPLHLRIVTIEDTGEWQDLPHENWMPLYFDGERRTATDCVQDALRMRPDWTPMQEVRGPEAWAFLRVQIIGAPGITTIHATDCRAALDAMALMVRQSPEGRAMDESTVLGLLREHIDIVAHCARQPFRITEVMEIAR